MRAHSAIVLGLGVAAFGLMGPRARAQAPACQDEEAVAQNMVQDVAAGVDTVKKETLSDFESKYHQKSLTNKLTFAFTAVDAALQCLDKATGDSTAAGRKDAESKLKARLSGYHDALKAQTDPKAAKELIGTFELPALATTTAAK
jgi:5'-deoxynucleotidase YfbR-like HD superfamily hydrolase